MVRFLHTADWHLGIPLIQLEEKADEAQEIRLETVHKIAEMAYEEEVDFILCAGDLFDSNEVDREIVHQAAEALKLARPARVFILPGNHDPLGFDSVYSDPIWEKIKNVTILKEARPLELDQWGVTLYPCPVSQKDSQDDPTAWIPHHKGKTIGIGLAHGNCQLGQIKVTNFPISPTRAKDCYLDYLALGEWHTYQVIPSETSLCPAVYPGAPETTKFGEEGSGQVLLVEISSTGKKPSLTSREVSNLKWKQIEWEISSLDDWESRSREVERWPHLSRTLLKLKVTGLVEPEGPSVIDEWAKKEEEKFFHLRVEKDNLHIKPDFARLRQVFPDSEGVILSQTLDTLKLLSEYFQKNREISPQVWQEVEEIIPRDDLSSPLVDEALSILYRLTREVSP